MSGEAARGLVMIQVDTRGFAAREFPRRLRPNKMAARPPKITRSQIPPATQATKLLEMLLYFDRHLYHGTGLYSCGIHFVPSMNVGLHCSYSPIDSPGAILEGIGFSKHSRGVKFSGQ